MLWNNSKRPEIPRDWTVREFIHPATFRTRQAFGRCDPWVGRHLGFGVQGFHPPWPSIFAEKSWKIRVPLGFRFVGTNLPKNKMAEIAIWFSHKFEWASYKLLFSLFGEFFLLSTKVNHHDTPPFKEEVWNFSLDSTTFFFSANRREGNQLCNYLAAHNMLGSNPKRCHVGKDVVIKAFAVEIFIGLFTPPMKAKATPSRQAPGV